MPFEQLFTAEQPNDLQRRIDQQKDALDTVSQELDKKLGSELGPEPEKKVAKTRKTLGQTISFYLLMSGLTLGAVGCGSKETSAQKTAEQGTSQTEPHKTIDRATFKQLEKESDEAVQKTMEKLDPIARTMMEDDLKKAKTMQESSDFLLDIAVARGMITEKDYGSHQVNLSELSIDGHPINLTPEELKNFSSIRFPGMHFKDNSSSTPVTKATESAEHETQKEKQNSNTPQNPQMTPGATEGTRFNEHIDRW